MSLGVFIGLRFGIDMKLFPSNPAEGIPSYLDEVRSPQKRLRMRNFAGGDPANVNGFYPTAIVADSSSSVGADNGLYLEQGTSAFANQDAGVRLSAFEEVPPFADSVYIAKFRIMDNTDIRAFVGWSVRDYYDINDNDTIAGDAVGFQFSSSRGDTTWQLITNNGGTQTTTNSGLAFSTSQIYILEIEFSSLGTSVRFRISGENSNVLMSDTVVTSNLPAVTSDLSPLTGIQNLASLAVKTSRWYWQEVWY